MRLTKNITKECLLCGDKFKTHTGKKMYCGLSSNVKRTKCSYVAHLKGCREAIRKRRQNESTRAN